MFSFTGFQVSVRTAVGISVQHGRQISLGEFQIRIAGEIDTQERTCFLYLYIYVCLFSLFFFIFIFNKKKECFNRL